MCCFFVRCSACTQSSHHKRTESTCLGTLGNCRCFDTCGFSTRCMMHHTETTQRRQWASLRSQIGASQHRFPGIERIQGDSYDTHTRTSAQTHHTQTHMYTPMHTRTHTRTYTHTDTCTRIQTQTRTRVQTHAHLHARMQTHARAYTRTHALTHTHT